MDDLHEEYIISEPERPASKFEFLFSLIGDDPREKPFRADPFVLETDSLTFETDESRAVSLSQALIKVQQIKSCLTFEKVLTEF